MASTIDRNMISLNHGSGSRSACNLAQTVETVRERLARAEARLEAAPAYDRIALWFEHDSYDQLWFMVW